MRTGWNGPDYEAVPLLARVVSPFSAHGGDGVGGECVADGVALAELFLADFRRGSAGPGQAMGASVTMRDNRVNTHTAASP
jgi:hypothetical protein